MSYVILASNNYEYQKWKTQYHVISEYPNLQAMEVSINNLELYNLKKSSKYKPIRSSLLQPTIKQTSSTSINDQITINAIEDADLMKVSDLWDLGYNGTGRS